MAEQLDEFGIPIKKKAVQETDEFGIPIKKKTSGKTSVTPSQTSSTDLGTNPFGAKPLNEFIGKEREQQVFKELRQQKPKSNLLSGISAKDFKEAGLQRQRDEISDMAGVTQREREKRDIDEKAFFANENQTSTGDKLRNAAENVWTNLKMAVPNLKVASTDIWEGVLGKEMAKSAFKNLNGEDIEKARLDAYDEINRLRSELKATSGSITDNIKYMNGSGLIVNLADALGGIVSTGVPAILTGGGATIPTMVGQNIVDYNTEKAKSKGVSVEELYKSGDAELKTPLLIGSMAGALELVGIKSVKNLASASIKGAGTKKMALYALELNKEGMTELLQGGLDAVNKAKAQGKSDEEAGKAFFDRVTSKEGLNEYLMGVFASGGVGAMSHVVGAIKDVGTKKKVEANIAEIAQLEQDLVNENVSPAVKAVIEEQVKKKVADISTEIDSADQAVEKLSDADKVKTEQLNNAKAELEAVVSEPNLSEAGKKVAEEQIKSIDKELSEIKPVEEVKAETEVITPTEEVKGVEIEFENEKGVKSKINTNDVDVSPDKASKVDLNVDEVANKFDIVAKDKKLGEMIIRMDGDRARVAYSEIKDNLQNKGLGSLGYEKMGEFLNGQGKVMTSSDTVSENDTNYRGEQADALWKSLERKGRAKQITEANGNTYYEYIPKQETKQPISTGENVETVQAPVLEETAQVAEPKSYGYEDIDAMTNEKDVASNLYDEIIEPTELTPVQQAIRNAGGFTTNEESFNRFGDRNNINSQVAKSYIRKDGKSLDVIAQELSKDGLEVTPQDLVEYMEQFNDGNSTYSGRAKALQAKLQDMTGKKYNKFTVKKYIDKLNAQAKAKIESDPNFMDENITATILDEGVTKDNIESLKDKIEFIYGEETYNNIKNYLNETDNGKTDASGTEATRVSEESRGLEEQATGEAKATTESERLAKAKEKLKSAKEEFSDFVKKSRGTATSGADLATFVAKATKLMAAYAEVGIVKLSDVLKEMRADYGDDFVNENIDGITQAHEQANVTEKAKETKTEPKEQSVSKEFEDLAYQNLESDELRETLSNVERETGAVLTDEEKAFKRVALDQAFLKGIDIVEKAKEEFGDQYAVKLLDYVDASRMPADNKSLVYISLENDLRKQLLADPKNNRLIKQIKLVQNRTIAYQRSLARGNAFGILRQIARVGYETQDALEAIFSPKEMERRSKVEAAVASTPDEVQKQAEERQAKLDELISEGVEKRVNEIYESLPSTRKIMADKAIAALDRIQKRLRSKTYDASIGLPIAILDAGITTIKVAIRTGVSVADAIELGIKKIKAEYGKNWDKENEFRNDMTDAFKKEGIEVKKDVNTNLKQELIDAGYNREMTVTTKDGKEKRKVLDWKKLLGTEGSFDNMRDAIEKSMKGKGYSQTEIDGFVQQLQDEYNDIHADIIQKSLNELNRRDAPKQSEQKTLARKLAEMYNLGAYESEPDKYSNLFNNALGINKMSQEAFNAIRDLNRSLAKLMESKDNNGNRYSDLALAGVEVEVKNKIKKVVDKVMFAEGNMFYKASVVIKNVFSAMQRMMLASVSQLIENPISAKYNDVMVKLQDLAKKGKWDTKDLADARKMVSKAIYIDVVVGRGEEYGGVGNPFTTKNSIEDFVNSLPERFFKGNGALERVGNVITASLSGRAYLDASDSFFKLKRTELEFTHNLLRVLTSPTNPKKMSQEDALRYVSNALTGQSFKDAMVEAEKIIKAVNDEAGKELIRDTESNIIRVANDLVKDNLVNGGAMTAKEVEASFKAGYTTAGKSIGHESNNLITDTVNLVNSYTQRKLNEAIKNKDWSTAAMLNITSILSKNIISPFVGGGTNWVVIGLQKMGVPTELLRSDVGFKNRAVDVSTIEGNKELKNELTAIATKQRMYGRIVVSNMVMLTALLGLMATGDDDEYTEWLRKHPDTRKLVNKVIPTYIAMYLARDNKNGEFLKAIYEALGSRQNFDAIKVKKAAEDFYKASTEYDERASKKAWGAVGEVVGRKFTVPYLTTFSNFGKTSENLRRELVTGEKKPDYSSSRGFISGFYKGGLIDYMGLRPTDGDMTAAEQRMVDRLGKMSYKDEDGITKNYMLNDAQLAERQQVFNEYMKDEKAEYIKELVAEYVDEGMNKEDAEKKANQKFTSEAMEASKQAMIEKYYDDENMKLKLKEVKKDD
jgi:hypothetical protein